MRRPIAEARIHGRGFAAAGWLKRRVAWAFLVVALGGVAAGLAGSQGQARAQLNSVFQARADIARQFVSSYVADLFNREQQVAARQLSGATISDAQFQAVTQSFGFSAAVVLDDRGDALDITPAAPAKIGTNLASVYLHLRSAEAGVPTVSHVVPSAATSRPIVAFAVPYPTAYGRRVLSGGFDVNTTPVATYLRNALPMAGANVYLQDVTSSVVVADTRGVAARTATLSTQAPQLAVAAAQGPAGNFQDVDGGRYFVSGQVPDTPWSVVMSVPDATLYAPLGGLAEWAPWAVFAALVVGSVAFGGVLMRLQTSRAALATANADLGRLARVDGLTDLYNRRHLDEQLDVLLQASSRDQTPLAVLMLDVDHFKRINDEHGHDAGDRALQSLAAVARANLRPGDIIGRWGGEEFLLVLPRTDANSARAVAERLRAAVAGTMLAAADAGDPGLRVTISVGVGLAEPGDQAHDILARADAALYRAKEGGRNAVAA